MRIAVLSWFDCGPGLLLKRLRFARTINPGIEQPLPGLAQYKPPLCNVPGAQPLRAVHSASGVLREHALDVDGAERPVQGLLPRPGEPDGGRLSHPAHRPVEPQVRA